MQLLPVTRSLVFWTPLKSRVYSHPKRSVLTWASTASRATQPDKDNSDPGEHNQAATEETTGLHRSNGYSASPADDEMADLEEEGGVYDRS